MHGYLMYYDMTEYVMKIDSNSFNLSDFIIVVSFSQTKNPPQHVMSDKTFILIISSLIFPKQIQ